MCPERSSLLRARWRGRAGARSHTGHMRLSVPRDTVVVVWFVYAVSNGAGTLYTGMTNDLVNRVRQHRDRTYANGFTARYTFNRLVYFEPHPTQSEAARRE